MEEAQGEPPHVLLVDRYFVVFRDRRQVMVSGKAPEGLWRNGRNPGRDWKRHQRLMAQEPPWEKALRYANVMEREGLRSARALARHLGLHHAGVAQTIELLKLSNNAFRALQDHAEDPRVRACFTQKRLLGYVEDPCEVLILREIDRTKKGHHDRHDKYNI